MANVTSADSATESLHTAFNGDRVVNSFPRHDVVKLDDAYIRWQQQVKLILDGYDLLGFLDGTLNSPSRFVQMPEGTLVPNPSAQIFRQQDRLLTSWLLSTISTSHLPSFIDAQSAYDIWTMAANLFATDTGAKNNHVFGINCIP
ncbi:hypothetical protein J1N35_028308 [Gossypium stocksii]|uniref:Retrotransposon Copia-like N-terminal domain-containing protein n=1 Tax=Gossypium stocksii TaxID=47602 RepID=A0A9D3ZQZ8_9ROSI|nr:hypothetical protein J1N35_028308 [Gossypium stocksii]